MTTIIYKISGGFGAITDFKRADTVADIFVGKESGTVKIGDVSAEVTDGRVTVALSSLPDGIYSPILFTKSGQIRLESIRKLGEKLTRGGTDRNLTMNMLRRIEELESGFTELASKVADLDKKVLGNGIFG